MLEGYETGILLTRHDIYHKLVFLKSAIMTWTLSRI